MQTGNLAQGFYIQDAKVDANLTVGLAGTINEAYLVGYRLTGELDGQVQAALPGKVYADQSGNITIQAAPGERLKGALLYKDATTKESKNVDFDAGYTLAEIKWGETVREQEVEEPELDNDGNPVQDPKTRKPKIKQTCASRGG